MASGALDVLGERLVSGFVIVPPGHLPAGFDERGGLLRVAIGSHPIPDIASVRAGEALREYVAALPRDAQVLCLISGGASSLVEVPVSGVGLDDLARVGAWAVSCGQPITVTNAVRRQLSRVKNGGLARWLQPRRTVALFISDVPGDDPRLIGSGLLHASRPREQQALLDNCAGITSDVAALLRHAHSVRERANRLHSDDDDELRSSHAAVPFHIVASQRSAALAAAATAQARGLATKLTRERFAGDAAELGAKFARATIRLRDRELRIWTGEATVFLPPAPGRGGRNQHLALSAACEFAAAGCNDRWLLAAGTDGVDGATEDAGALVDGQTCMRGRDAGCDARVSLERADSGSFLEAAGDLLHTGPTYTNVGDMVLGLCWKGTD